VSGSLGSAKIECNTANRSLETVGSFLGANLCNLGSALGASNLCKQIVPGTLNMETSSGSLPPVVLRK
tara:strand:+ start:1452 stop:1655 length:204 start_codon:yes stop_codon:yes gene_type:complete